jgi:hypothetical protein
MKLDKFFKIGTFIISCLSFAFLVYQYFDKPDPLKDTRINTYRELSSLVGKIINTQDVDSLKGLSKLYGEMHMGVMVLINDSLTSIAMKRFKYDLDDKIKGDNILNSDKYKTTGIELIKYCKNNIKNNK